MKVDFSKGATLIPILQLLLEQDTDSVMMEWIMKKAWTFCTQEVIAASDISNGLHFNASKATAEEITAFQLDSISEKFQKASPHTWHFVQSLLDLKQDAQCWIKPTKMTISYDNRHEVQEDQTDILGNVIQISDTDSDSIVGESTPVRKSKSEWHAECRNMALLQIMSFRIVCGKFQMTMCL